MKEEKNDDIEIDSSDVDDSVVAEGSAQESIKKLRERLKETETKAKEYLDGWQRNKADFINLRKRDEEAKIEFIKYAKLSILEGLIPVLDSFNIALSHPLIGSGQETNIKPIYDQLMGILKVNGLEEIEPLGNTFNPQEHEALGAIQTEEKEKDHKVLEILQKGYKLNGKVIRPAKVKIGEFIKN